MKYSYYSTDKVSDRVSDLIDKRPSYDKFALYCLFSVNYTPAKHTIYDGVFKKVEAPHISIPQPGKKRAIDLDSYKKILKEAVLSESSSNNWIQYSGGLDTTIVLALLLEEYDACHIHPMISSVVDGKGNCINPHDVMRAESVCRHYGIKLHKVPLETLGSCIADYFLRDVQILRDYSFISFGPSDFSMADYIEARRGSDDVVYSGEGADSVINFGFTKSRPSSRDKKKSSYYSPSYFRRLPESELLDYLFTFAFSSRRYPFALSPVFGEITDLDEFKAWLYRNYFGEAIRKIGLETFYYWLMRIYFDFHLQGKNIQTSFAIFTVPTKMPYLNKEVVQFYTEISREGLYKKYLSWELAERLKVPTAVIKELDYKAFKAFSPLYRSLLLSNKYVMDIIQNTLGICWGDFVSLYKHAVFVKQNEAVKGTGHSESEVIINENK